jgi:hypothetical protein
VSYEVNLISYLSSLIDYSRDIFVDILFFLCFISFDQQDLKMMGFGYETAMTFATKIVP